jgi:hypothetical protein
MPCRYSAKAQLGETAVHLLAWRGAFAGRPPSPPFPSPQRTGRDAGAAAECIRLAESGSFRPSPMMASTGQDSDTRLIACWHRVRMKSQCRSPSSRHVPPPSWAGVPCPNQAPVCRPPRRPCIPSSGQVDHHEHRGSSHHLIGRITAISDPFLIRHKIPLMGTEPIPSAKRSQAVTRLMLAFPHQPGMACTTSGCIPRVKKAKSSALPVPVSTMTGSPSEIPSRVAVSGWIRRPGRGAISLRSGFSRFSVCR